MKKLLTIMCCAMLAMGAWAQDQSDESDLSLGIQGGVGGFVSTGTLKDNFGGAIDFTAGLTADYKRLRLKADFGYAQPSFKNYNIYDVKDEEGRDAQINNTTKPTQFMLGVQLGYKVWNNKRIAITPAAGMFMNHYSWILNDIEWSKNDKGEDVFKVTESHSTKLNSVSWMASVDVEIKLHEKFTTEPFMLNGRYSRLTSYLRITPWIGHARYNKCVPAVKGNYVGVTLRYAGFMRSLGF